jgi:hypothetical protein
MKVPQSRMRTTLEAPEIAGFVAKEDRADPEWSGAMVSGVSACSMIGRASRSPIRAMKVGA